MFLLNNTPLSAEYILFLSSTIIVSNALQDENACNPIKFTEDGIVTETNELQPTKA